ncbi:NACHT domain protein [Fusarium austroafricanum]|uniref:NACHT domain protein n=1 Tax=Fusarium austroafricanum TaxID=2364996 RepID=A0A8H4KQP9_9HYPO|nr:NACHT domain protein [Fusarium austroafricanum]
MAPSEPFQNVKALIVGPSSPAVPSEIHQAVAEFQAVLTEEQRQEFSRTKKEKPVDCILTFTAELDLENRKKRRGHSIASRLRHVLQTVQEFSTVIDTFMSSNPDTAALIWGSVKFTILIAMNAVSFYEALSEFFLGLKDMLPRFSEYFTLYPQSVRLQKSLCDLYASLIHCCKHVVEASRRKWPSVFARSVVQSFEQEFRKDKADIQSHYNNVNEDIQLAKAQADKQEQKLQLCAREDASQHDKGFEEFADRTDNSLNNLTIQQRQSRERRVFQQKQSVLDNLSSHNYQAPFIQGQRSRYPGTSEWLAKTPEFIGWKNGHDSGLFWLTGKIGAGKTILTTAIIDQLLIDKKTPNDPVTFFFCRFDDKASLSVEALLRCILRQMLSVSDLDDDFQGPIASIDDSVDKESFLLNELLMSRVKQFKEVFIVVDGVDECEPADRQRIISTLHSLIKSGSCVKVFLASRERLESDLKKVFKPESSGVGTYTHLSIEHPSAQSDIATYIDQVISLKSDQEELQLMPWLLAARSPLTLDQLEEVADVRINQPRSMPERYLNGIEQIASWFENLIKIDEETRSVHFVHSSVQQFFLAPVYKAHQNGFHKPFIDSDQYLGDICLTYLNFSDFKTALGVDVIPKVEPTRLIESTIASSSSSAVNRSISRNQENPVSYMHQRGRSLYQDSDQDPQQTSHADEKNNHLQHEFLSYAAVNWFYHTVNFNSESSTFNILRKIVLTPGGYPWVIRPWKDNIQEPKDLGEIFPLILDLQHDGLLEVALATRNSLWCYPFEDMLMLAIARNTPGLIDWFFNHFPILSKEEYVSILEVILHSTPEFRMDAVDAIFRLGRGPDGEKTLLPTSLLCTAVEARVSHVVEELLRRGANPDLRERYYNIYTGRFTTLAYGERLKDVSMLHIACVNNDYPTVLSLALYGSSLDVTDSKGRTPLSYVVARYRGAGVVRNAILHIRLTSQLGSESHISDLTIHIVTKLIELKANIEVGQPLLRAIEAGNDDIAWLLIQAGANVNARRGLTTCLKMAKNGGQGFIVDELRKFGVK